MRIWEIEWRDGKVYKCSDGKIWTVNKYDLKDEYGRMLTERYQTKKIVELEFENCVDWSKIEVDTKVLVSTNGDIWIKRHFAKYEDGVIYTFANNGSSWTEDKLASWEYGKLTN